MAVDPQGPPTGTYRVVRGGGWHDCRNYARLCRSAYRNYGNPGSWIILIGFRVVLAPGQ